MKAALRLAVSLAAGGAVAAIGAWILVRIRHRQPKDPLKIERLRRLDLSRRGRITGGTIVDFLEEKQDARTSWTVIYKYEVAGVTYEASQDVSWMEDAVAGPRFLLGQAANVKYETVRPVNSIIASEEWSGLPEQLDKNREVPSVQASRGEVEKP